jgi:hypothetical protein
MVKNGTAAASEPVELRPRTVTGGRIDVASLRWTIEHMRGELEGTAELGRVRNALAIALMELDRVERERVAVITDDLGWSRYFPWTSKPT